MQIQYIATCHNQNPIFWLCVQSVGGVCVEKVVVLRQRDLKPFEVCGHCGSGASKKQTP